MTLKEELEILRGEPIKVFEGTPMDIPCLEKSDRELLCRHPVVSVHMLAYNHEPYIRQAIESVMMQKTDFEFELVIGEDASVDKTREICFEYQARYPDKIRVLWWHENLNRVRHPAGNNARRTTAHCRGEFIAFCEGDDYWVDPLKLQKQYSLMRKHPNVALIFAQADVLYQEKNTIQPSLVDKKFLGLQSGTSFFKELATERQFSYKRVDPNRLRTPTVMLSANAMRFAKKKHEEIFSWRLPIGDTTLWLALASCGDVFFMPDVTSVYRRHSRSVSSSMHCEVMRDASLVKVYFCCREYGMDTDQVICYFREEFFFYWVSILSKMPSFERKERISCLKKERLFQIVFDGLLTLPYRILLSLDFYKPTLVKLLDRICRRLACMKSALARN